MHVAATYFNLHATSSQAADKNVSVAASRMQNWHALATITLQSRQYFAMTLVR